MGLLDSTQTIKFEPQFYAALKEVTTAMGHIATATYRLSNAVTTYGESIMATLDELVAKSAEVKAAVGTLTTAVQPLPDAVNALEQVINDLKAQLDPNAQAKIDEAFNNIAAVATGVTDAAATIGAAVTDAGDGSDT